MKWKITCHDTSSGKVTFEEVVSNEAFSIEDILRFLVSNEYERIDVLNALGPSGTGLLDVRPLSNGDRECGLSPYFLARPIAGGSQ